MVDYWKTQEDESRWAREDDSVRSEAQRLGLGYVDEQRDEGAPSLWVLQHARQMGEAVTKVLDGFRPPVTSISMTTESGAEAEKLEQT